MCLRQSTLCIFCYLFFAFFSNAQSSFSDSFSDGNFLNNPSWSGDVNKFQVNTVNQLQLNDPSAATSEAHLVTTSNIISSGSWEFYVQMNFAPSASNFCRVYLSSDNPNLKGSLNGYYIQIGGQSGTVDEVSLYRQNGTSKTLLIDGVNGTVANSPKLKVKITKSTSANWELFIDTSITFGNYISQGVITDNTITTSSYFGIFCDYSSTRADKFFFDDFSVSGQAAIDTTAPRLTSVTIMSDSALNLTFSEFVDDSTAVSLLNYTVNNTIGNPKVADIDPNDSSNVQLSFSNRFVNGNNYSISVENIEDRKGNKMRLESLSFFYFVPILAKKRDVVINEIYPDFNPTNGLPEAEFIELYNASNKIFDMSNWKLTDGNSSANLTSLFLLPNEYLILCSEDFMLDYEVFGKTKGIKSFPSLNNKGDSIRLIDNANQLIDEVNYMDNWYKDDSKDDGGYSLEQINPFSQCSGTNNFSASFSPIGGTPGKINSIFDSLPDVSPPTVISAYPISPDSLIIQFNELIDVNSIKIATYTFSNGTLVDSAASYPKITNSILLIISPPLAEGIEVALNVLGIKDCSGNEITQEVTRDFALPELSDLNDVVINEILFNPKIGGSDFIELYNRSNKIISLKNWKIANFSNDSIANRKPITTVDYILYPNEYLGITENINNITRDYPKTLINRFVEIADLPTYNDNEGTVYLFNENDQLIDQVSYSDNMHFELLDDEEGVSLERINFDRPSNDVTNFHSASEAEGFATPAYQNSQFFAGNSIEGKITIDPKTISPDNDGFQDILTINYKFSTPGYVANVSIFDRNGRLTKSLINNELLGNSGTFYWDGITNENTKARIGIYIVLVEVFNLNGDQEMLKETVVVAGKL